MFASKPRRVSLTLFCYLALVLTLASVAQADTLNHQVARDHVNINRMIKKRADGLNIPGLNNLGTNGAAGDPPSFSDSNSPSPTPSASGAAPAPSQSSASGPASSASDSSSSAANSSSSAASSASSGSSSASASASSSSGSSVSSTSSAAPTPTPAKEQPDNNNNNDDDDTSNNTSKHSASFVFQTVTGSALPTDTSVPVMNGATASVPKTALTVIIVIASCVAAVAIGWTVIRKWKFKPSSDFEDRMAPIDWQPTTADEGIPGVRRNASTASHGSFHSAGHSDENFAGRGVGNSYGAADYGQPASLQPIPDHDFTAGPTTLAPVGGYADLARGPSPQPPMSELNRGPSVNRGYDSYGVPLHHQGAYDYNGTGAGRY